MMMMYPGLILFPSNQRGKNTDINMHAFFCSICLFKTQNTQNIALFTICFDLMIHYKHPAFDLLLPQLYNSMSDESFMARFDSTTCSKVYHSKQAIGIDIVLFSGSSKFCLLHIYQNFIAAQVERNNFMVAV